MSWIGRLVALLAAASIGAAVTVGGAGWRPPAERLEPVEVAGAPGTRAEIGVTLPRSPAVWSSRDDRIDRFWPMVLGLAVTTTSAVAALFAVAVSFGVGRGIRLLGASGGRYDRGPPASRAFS